MLRVRTILNTVFLLVIFNSWVAAQKVAPPDTCAQRAALSPDGMILVTAGTPTHPIHAFRTDTGPVAWTDDIRREKAPVNTLVLSPTGKYVVIGYWSSSFERLAVASGQPLPTTMPSWNDGVRDMAFSGDGRFFAVLTQASDIRVYTTSDWKEVRVIANAAHNGLALSADGARVAAGLYSSEVRTWEVSTGKLIRTIRVKGGKRWFRPMDKQERQAQLWKAAWKVEFSPDGKQMATATDGYIQLWDTVTGVEIGAVKSGGRTGTLTFSADGMRIGWATWNGELRIWNFRGHHVLTLKAPTTSGEIAFSPDFTRAYVPDWRESVRVIAIPLGKQVSAFICSTR